MYVDTDGLVLRETNYKEADKILTVLTRDLGKRTVKARACRRRHSKIMGAAQLLTYSHMTLFEKQERLTLQEASVTQQFLPLRQDLLLLSLASYFAELTEQVAAEGTAQPELLTLMLNSLYALGQLQKEPKQVKAAFELALMCLSGYEPLIDQCAVCGKEAPEDPRLHLLEGKLHCASCRGGLVEGISVPLNASALLVMRHIAWGEEKKLFSFRMDEASLALLGEATEAFLLTQLERGFRTLDFYKQMKGDMTTP